MSLYENINKRRRAGTSRSKANSTVDPKTYEKMRKKAESELELLDFERAFEAVKAMDIGIQGERKTMEGMVNLQFVQDVLSVLVEEITDPDVITKVANRLRRLVAERDDIE